VTGVGGLDALVVDDDEDLARTTVAVLETERLKAAQVATVAEALAVLTNARIGCLVVDHDARLEEPGALLSRAGALPPIVLMSGDPEGLARCAELWGERVFAYRVKPVPPATLVALVKRAVRDPPVPQPLA
jgi:DNA-binding NtrC family response regulator